jgi:hypothetical protein
MNLKQEERGERGVSNMFGCMGISISAILLLCRNSFLIIKICFPK